MTKSYSPFDLQKMPVLGLVPESSVAASPPAAPVDGQLWWDTTNHKLNVYVSSVTNWFDVFDERIRLNDLAVAGDINWSGFRITNLGTPAGPSDAATRAYVDGLVGGGGPPTGTAGGDLASSYPNPTVIKAQDGFYVGTSPGTGQMFAGQVYLRNTAATDIIRGRVTGDTQSRFTADSGGIHKWGDGSSPTLDTNLYRSAADTLKTDDSFVVGTNLTVTGTGTLGGLGMTGQKITNLADPTVSTDAATKNYVDTVAQGLDAKASVRAATTVSISAGGIPGGAQTIDGFATGNQERILVKNQSTPANNGIWITNSGGSWARATDLDTWGEVPGAFVFVEEGTTQADTGWVSTADQTGTFGTTAITWAQFSSAGSYTGGNGLTLTGNDFAVNVDGSSIEINADILRVKALGITNAMLAGSIDATTKLTGAVPVANGGTAAITVAAARNNLVVPGKATIASPALTANTWSANIAHGLGPSVTAPHVQVTEAATGENVIIDWKIIDVNNIQLRAGMAVSAAALNVLVHA